MTRVDKDVRAVLFDDESESPYVEGVVHGAEEFGFAITPVGGVDALTSSLANEEPDLLIVDMKMGMSAKQIARDSVRRYPRLAVFFWTGFPADPDFADLDQSLNPLVRCSKGTKLPGADGNPEVLYESLIKPATRLLNEREGRAAALEVLRASDREGSGIYQMTLEDFVELDSSTAETLLIDAQRQASPITDLIFAQTKAEWVLVAGPKLDVIRWGASVGNMPDTGRIRDLGNRYGYVPVLFVRPIEVDDTSYMSSSDTGWAECGPGDYYPNLGVNFLNGRGQKRQVHFDTGTPKTLLSLEECDDAQVLGDWSNLDLRTGVRVPNRGFVWLDKVVHLVLSDGHDSRTIKLRVMVVKNWSVSPFARLCSHGDCPGTAPSPGPTLCARREIGLLGRDLLTDGHLVVVLDGVRRATFFYREPEPPRRGLRRILR